jgi:hypothetical protein
VRIARTIAALAVLGCAFGLGWAEERLLCRGESGYEIRRAYLLLEEERFSEEELRRVFAPYAESELNGELYVVATSDPRLHDELVNPRWYLESVHTAFSSTPLLTDGPLAYFYRLGENAFFHYGRKRGESRWVVIRGEDVFNRRFGGTRLRFVGQDFFQSVSERRCGRRMLVFVSTEVKEDDLPDEPENAFSRTPRSSRNGGSGPIFGARITLSGREEARFELLKDEAGKPLESRTTLGCWIGSGRFPKPVRLGPNITARLSNEIAEWERRPLEGCGTPGLRLPPITEPRQLAAPRRRAGFRSPPNGPSRFPVRPIAPSGKPTRTGIPPVAPSRPPPGPPSGRRS